MYIVGEGAVFNLSEHLLEGWRCWIISSDDREGHEAEEEETAVFHHLENKRQSNSDLHLTDRTCRLRTPYLQLFTAQE